MWRIVLNIPYSKFKLQRPTIYFISYSPIGKVTVLDEGSVVGGGGVVDEDGVVETEVVTPEVLTKSQGKNKKQGLSSDCTLGSHNIILNVRKKSMTNSVKFPICSKLKLQRLTMYFILYSPIGNVTVVDDGGVVETEVVTREVLTKSQGKNKTQGLLSGCTFRCHNTISQLLCTITIIIELSNSHLVQKRWTLDCSQQWAEICNPH